MHVGGTRSHGRLSPPPPPPDKTQREGDATAAGQPADLSLFGNPPHPEVEGGEGVK